MSLFSFRWLKLIRQQGNGEPILSLIKEFNDIANHDAFYEGIKHLIVYTELTNEELIVATELLLGSDNSSIDIDFSYILAVAQSFSLLLLKKLLIFLHNGQNHKIISLPAKQASAVLAAAKFDESEWNRICSRYMPLNLNKLRKAVFSKGSQTATTQAEIWSDDDVHADVSALNSIFEKEAVSMHYIGDWNHLMPPILEPAFDEWRYLDGLDSGQLLVWNPVYRNDMGGINVNALLESATTRVLSSHEISMISEKLIMDPAIIAQFDINDEKIVALISWNWSLVVELICSAFTVGLQDQYLDSFLRIDIGVKLLEVIFELVSRQELSATFLNAIITRSMKQCAQTNDIAIQNRIVKAFCALVELLLKQFPDKVLSQFAELLSFCVSYSHIPDCTLLYKHMKDFEGDIDF